MCVYEYIRPIQPDGIYSDCHLHLTAVRCVCRQFCAFCSSLFSFCPDSPDCCSFLLVFVQLLYFFVADFGFAFLFSHFFSFLFFFFFFLTSSNSNSSSSSLTGTSPAHIGYALLAASAFEIVQISRPRDSFSPSSA